MYNDPAFQLFLMATTSHTGFAGRRGRQDVARLCRHGRECECEQQPYSREMDLIYNASHIPSALMAAALHEQDFLCPDVCASASLEIR